MKIVTIQSTTNKRQHGPCTHRASGCETELISPRLLEFQLESGAQVWEWFGQIVLVFIGDWKQIHNDRKSSVSWHGKSARALAWETDTGTCPLGRGPALLLRDSLWKLTGR